MPIRVERRRSHHVTLHFHTKFNRRVGNALSVHRGGGGGEKEEEEKRQRRRSRRRTRRRRRRRRREGGRKDERGGRTDGRMDGLTD